MLDIVIKIIPIHSFIFIFSLNNNAINEVETISKLFKSDIDEEIDFERPINNNIGAKISNIIIRIIYFKSFFSNEISLSFITANFLSPYIIIIPIPAPRYNKPASIVDNISFNNIFEIGVLNA